VFSLPGGEKQGGVRIDRSEKLTVKSLTTYADGVFEKTSGQPMSVKRGDVAIWLHSLACLNGYC